jgi:hypothetical protein
MPFSPCIPFSAFTSFHEYPAQKPTGQAHRATRQQGSRSLRRP